MKKIEFFKIEGKDINRIRKHCPKCGPGVFLADHKNRFSCGKCGYTEFKGGVKPQRPPKTEEKTKIEATNEPKVETSDEPKVETQQDNVEQDIKQENEKIQEPRENA